MRLSIESDNGDEALKVFGDQRGLGIAFLSFYPKIGGGRIYSRLLRPRGLPLTFAALYMFVSNPRLVETGR